MKDATSTPSFLLVDARSYTAAVANRAKGGGCEYQGKYLKNIWIKLTYKTNKLSILEIYLRKGFLNRIVLLFQNYSVRYYQNNPDTFCFLHN